MKNVPTKIQIIIVTFLGVFIFFGGIKYQQIRLHDLAIEVIDTSGNLNTEETEPSAPEEVEEKKIAVHVVGAVEKPAVYSFSPGARVEDAVMMAVPLKEADLGRLNLALLLQDGKQIDVPFKEEHTGKGTGKDTAATAKKAQEISSDKYAYVTPADQLGAALPETGASGKININTASKEELTVLPRIGPAIAGRIREYREKEGPFKNIEELNNVSGIGEATFAQLKDLITVE